jgi:hypothetical protein
MATFAVLDTNNVVVDVILADDLGIAEAVTRKTCAEYTDENRAGIGYIYNGTNFINPNAPVEADDESSTEL